MSCSCGFSRNYPECDGTHKIVKLVKNKILIEIEKIDIGDENNNLNALCMKLLVIDAIKKVNGV